MPFRPAAKPVPHISFGRALMWPVDEDCESLYESTAPSHHHDSSDSDLEADLDETSSVDGEGGFTRAISEEDENEEGIFSFEDEDIFGKVGSTSGMSSRSGSGSSCTFNSELAENPTAVTPNSNIVSAFPDIIGTIANNTNNAINASSNNNGSNSIANNTLASPVAAATLSASFPEEINNTSGGIGSNSTSPQGGQQQTQQQQQQQQQRSSTAPHMHGWTYADIFLYG